MTQVPSAIFIALVAATIGQRILELLRSRSNQATMRSRGFLRVDSSRSYRYMVTVHATWLLAMLIEHAFAPRDLPPFVPWIALVVFMSAQVLRLWALRSLGSQWNTQIMTPSGDRDQLGLVAIGPYRYVRHPNYLAVILEFLALPLVGNAPVTTAVWSCFNGIVLSFRIRHEEKHLRKRPGYEERLSRVPCLIPKLWAR